HRKLLIIDDQVGGLGGLNIGAEYGGSWIVSNSHCEPWRDNAIGLRGPGARHLLRAFINVWRYLHTGGRIGRAGYSHNLLRLDRADGRSAGVANEQMPPENEFGLLASVPAVNPILSRRFSRLVR